MPTLSSSSGRLLALALLLALLAGCGGEPPPRTLNEIFLEQMSLPGVYFTGKENKRLLAPMGNGPFLDKASNDLAWPAVACYNPACPGKGPEGEPFLFFVPDSTLIAKPDGTLARDNSPKTYGPLAAGDLVCKHCLKIRNVNTENKELQQKYAGFVRQYVLPETIKRQKELEDERRKRAEFEKKGK